MEEVDNLEEVPEEEEIPVDPYEDYTVKKRTLTTYSYYGNMLVEEVEEVFVPLEEPKPGEFDGIKGWTQVGHDEVGGFLNDGWEIIAHYSKMVTMCLRGDKK